MVGSMTTENLDMMLKLLLLSSLQRLRCEATRQTADRPDGFAGGNYLGMQSRSFFFLLLLLSGKDILRVMTTIQNPDG